jgi:hypothetical protein
MVTMDVYGHLFPGQDEDLADRLDSLWSDPDLWWSSGALVDNLRRLRDAK